MLVWQPTKDDKFSVKLAYHLELEKNKRKGGEPSREGIKDPKWNFIWRLKVLGSVKDFIW